MSTPALVLSAMIGLVTFPAPPEPPPEALVSRERLLAEIRALPEKRAPNGSDAHREGLRRTEEILLERLRGFGYEPVTHEVDFLGSPRAARQGDGSGSAPAPVPSWRNIIVEIPGRSRPQEVLIFAAHFDAVPRSPGADDNGSGTVALLEMARLLKSRPMQRTLRLIFFNLEEVGLVGSRAYVESIEDQIKGLPDPAAAGEDPPRRLPPSRRILGMASIDGVGYFTDEPGSQKSPIPESPVFKPPTVGDFLAIGGIGRHRRYSQALTRAIRAAAPELKVVTVDFLPIAPPDLLRSDHAPFLAQGVPAVILADTANFRSPHYHQPTDTWDTLDPERYTLVVRGLVGAAHALAGPEGHPLIDLEPIVIPSAPPQPPQPPEPAAPAGDARP